MADTPSSILSRAADLIRDTAAAASPGVWTAEDMTDAGHPGVWWVDCVHRDADGTTYSTVADLETMNPANDARWIALLSPAVSPWLESILRRAAGRINWATSWDEVADIGERHLAEHVIRVLGMGEENNDGC